MTTLKELLGSAVYDENDVSLGQIRDVLFDKTTGKCLPMLSGGVYAVDKLTANNKSVVASNAQQTVDCYPTIIDKAAYDTLGKRLGTVVDATIGKSMTVGKIILDNGQKYGRGRVLAVGDIVLIKIAKPAKKRTKTTKEQVQVCATKQTKPANVNTPVITQSTKRRYGDFSFLIGKTADKNIINFYGEVMIHLGETVTPDILRQAKRSGKLIELCLHVK